MPAQAPAPAPAPQAASNTNAPKIAASTTRMGGALAPYADTTKGYRINKPSAWNDFEGDPGGYDKRWVDVVARDETVTISTIPVKSTTASVEALGEAAKVGASLAKGRSATLVSARARSTEGYLFYDFDFANGASAAGTPVPTHELLTMVVAKSKLWSVSAKSPEKRWSRMQDTYINVIGSFVPKL